MKALDRSVEMFGLWIATSLVTFIKSVNQSSIKPCLIVHLVAMWTLICFARVLDIYLWAVLYASKNWIAKGRGLIILMHVNQKHYMVLFMLS